MTISADERLELRELAQAAWGDRGAELLMTGLAGADLEGMEERLALRIDLHRSELRTEIGGLRGEMHGQFGELRGQIGELKGEIGELRGYVGMEIGGLRGEIGKQNKLFLFSIIASIAAVASIVFGALQIAA